MRRTAFVLLLIAVITLFAVPVSAHPGNTDSNGGHYDHSTGDYHYHHGYPAHDHPGGKCPYDFASGNNSNSASSGSLIEGLWFIIISVVSSGGGLGLVVIGVVVLLLILRRLAKNKISPKLSKSGNRATADTINAQSQFEAVLSQSIQPALSQDIQEFDYSWDDSWDDYIETDTEDSKTEDSIEDLYDFYDNLPDI